MRIIRFLDSADHVHYGVDQLDGTALRIQGDIFANHTVTHQKVAVKKLLAPVVPPAIMCIGLNYRKHAEETGSKLPQFPILFFKNPGSVQNLKVTTPEDLVLAGAILRLRRGESAPSERAPRSPRKSAASPRPESRTPRARRLER